MIGIYKITNPVGRVYVGQSKDIEKRKEDYRLLRNKNQIKIHRSILKYGWENHMFEVLKECEICDIDDLEVFYIKELNATNRSKGLNLKTGGVNSRLNQESINKMAKSLREKYKNDPEYRFRFQAQCKSNGLKLKVIVRPQETLDKIRNTKILRGTLKMKESSYIKMTETKRRMYAENPELKAKLLEYSKLSSGNNKPVRCILTDRRWKSCKEMCEEMGLNIKYTRKQLNGSRTNFTTFEYVRK